MPKTRAEIAKRYYTKNKVKILAKEKAKYLARTPEEIEAERVKRSAYYHKNKFN